MPLTRTLAGVLWVFLLVTAFGQAKPDFSGKWIQVDPAVDQPVSSMTVSQDAETLTVAAAPPDSEPHRVTFKLDGSETMFTSPETGREVVSIAAWDGNRLVISTLAHSNGYGAYTVRQTWSLERETLVVAVALISRTTVKTFSESKMTYRKAS